MEIMNARLSFGDKLLADSHREWKIRHSTAMQVTDFPPTDVEEDHPTSIRRCFDAGPRPYLAMNPLRDGVHAISIKQFGLIWKWFDRCRAFP